MAAAVPAQMMRTVQIGVQALGKLGVVDRGRLPMGATSATLKGPTKLISAQIENASITNGGQYPALRDSSQYCCDDEGTENRNLPDDLIPLGTSR